MSPLPSSMIDRWLNRTEPGPDQGVVCWHILMGDDPQACAATVEAQEVLAGFPDLHMTPLRWLHVSLVAVGSTNEISRAEMSEMLNDVGRSLRGVAPIPVTLDKVLYHPEAIALRVHPAEGLVPILDAVRSATRRVTHRVGDHEIPLVGGVGDHVIPHPAVT